MGADVQTGVKLRVLDGPQVARLENLCDWIVPGSLRVGPVAYIDAVLAAMPDDARAGALAAIDSLSEVASVDDLAARQNTPAFGLVRALAIEAFYSDFVAPGSPGPGAWSEIDFQPPRDIDLDHDWSWLGVQPS